MNLNAKQILAIATAVLAVLMVSTSQLTDLFGSTTTKSITAGAGLLNMILSSVLAVLTSQGSTVRDVAAMPGVEKIRINAQANQTLASIATDPTQPKVGATPEDVTRVKAIATGDVK